MNLATIRAEDVTIGQLKIKAPAGAAERAARELTLAAWPRASGRSWIFIRRVHAQAPGSQMGAAVSAAARRILDGAAGDGLVMRFASLETLLAHLLTDLTTGRASRRWYWRRWAHLFSVPIGRALVDVMAEHGAYLPAVTAELARMNMLPVVWNRLDRQGAAGLMETVAHRHGVDRMHGEAAVLAITTEEEELPIPAFMRTRWTTTLETLESSDPRCGLALMLIGQEIFPLMMLRRPLMVFRQLNRALVQPSFPDTIRPQAVTPVVAADQASAAPQPVGQRDREPVAPGIGSIQREPARRPAPESAGEAAHDPTPSAAGKASGRRFPGADAIDGQPRQGQAEGVDQERAALQGKKTAAAATDAQIPSRREDVLESTPAATIPSSGAPLDPSRPRASQRLRPETESEAQPLDRFVTTQGGLFFLLNFLKREDVQQRIQQQPTEEALASGWGWLYRLGEELALDASDPVVGFLAFQMGLDNSEALEGLPPLPARDDLLTLARQLYGRFGLWQPDLLRLNARVQYTPSHVDLYASLQSVRMPVRLAGLDLDPGWMPWLGRVVTFIYE